MRAITKVETDFAVRGFSQQKKYLDMGPKYLKSGCSSIVGESMEILTLLASDIGQKELP